MGGRRGKKAGSIAAPGSHAQLYLRGEKQGKNQSDVNAKTKLKLDHLKTLALWATEASIPPLAAFFAERLAATHEALGIRTDSSLFLCGRCETVLQPGNNCTVRVETCKRKKHRSKKPGRTAKNSVVFKCHFCSHRNTMRGSPQGYPKEILPPKAKSHPKSKTSISTPTKDASSEQVTETPIKVDQVESIAAAMPNIGAEGTATPPPPPPTSNGLTLLESKMKKRSRSRGKKPDASSSAEATTIPSSSKRRKRSWMSLKEISVRDAGIKLTNSIPFFV